MTTEPSNKKKMIITSALPYVNNSPHLGNIIGSVLSGDIFARYARKQRDVVYICGTDDFGTATELAAKKNNTTCENIVKENKEIMVKVFDWFNLKFDYFGGTSEKKDECQVLKSSKSEISSHARVVQAIYNKVKDERIGKDVMSQFYCKSCEMFLADRYLTGTCQKCKAYGVQGDQCDACGILLKNEDIIDPECVICKSRPEMRETEHLFLLLDKYTDKLQELYDKHSDGWTKNSRDITLTWLQKDLHPRCITRDLKWGIPVPGTDKVFYVWFDAVIGYISFFFSFLDEQRRKMQEKKAENSELANKQTHLSSEHNSKDGDISSQLEKLDISGCNYDSLKEIFDSYELVQFMGKDNVPFHTIIFPVITDSIAHKLSVTEYLMFENKKFSKSKKIGIFGSDLLDNSFGPSDLWRYYLCKIRPETKDSNFSVEDFTNSVQDLQNNFGNLCNRVLKFIKNKNNGLVAIQNTQSADITAFVEEIEGQIQNYIDQMESINLKKALSTLGSICQSCNLFLQAAFNDPIKKGDKLNYFSIVFSVIRALSELYDPFIPETCAKLRKMCKIEPFVCTQTLKLIENHKIADEIDVLFKPLDENVTKKLETMRGE